MLFFFSTGNIFNFGNAILCSKRGGGAATHIAWCFVPYADLFRCGILQSTYQISKDGFPSSLLMPSLLYLVNVVVSIRYISFEYKKRGFPPLELQPQSRPHLSPRRCPSQKLSTTTNLEWKLIFLLYLTFFPPLTTDQLKKPMTIMTNHYESRYIDFFFAAAVITDFFLVHFCA